MNPLPPRQPEPSPPGDVEALDPRRATGKRIAAAFLDLVALFVFYQVMAVAGGQTTIEDGEVESELRGTGVWLFLVVVAFYYTGGELAYRATPGKLLLGLRVVSANGARPTARAIAVRNVFRIIDWLPVAYIAGLVLLATSRSRQRLGDRLAGTVVVQT